MYYFVYFVAYYPYETYSAVAALQNGFKNHCRMAAKGLAAAVANFGCSERRIKAVWQRQTAV